MSEATWTSDERAPAEPLHLTEFEQHRLRRGAITTEQGRELWANHREWIDVQFPTVATEDCWILQPKGYVGFAALGDGTRLTVSPRVPVRSIFEMWQIAFGAESPKILPGQTAVESLDDLFTWIAIQLSLATLGLVRRGIFREYVEEADELSALRGRLDLRGAIDRPWRVRLPCEFQELRTDVADNQLLATALETSTRSLALQSGHRLVRHAYRALLQHGISTAEFDPEDCLGREYNRLNRDYEPLHWLCHFILAGSGPTHRAGANNVQPFLVNMPRLFERFVAEWLRRNSGVGTAVDCQKRLNFHPQIEFQPDLVLRDPSGGALAVVDTKYKIGSQVDVDDVLQVVAYAEALSCSEAVLVYPQSTHPEVVARIGSVTVRTLGVPLEHHVEAACRKLRDDLLEAAGNRPALAT